MAFMNAAGGLGELFSQAQGWQPQQTQIPTPIEEEEIQVPQFTGNRENRSGDPSQSYLNWQRNNPGPERGPNWSPYDDPMGPQNEADYNAARQRGIRNDQLNNRGRERVDFTPMAEWGSESNGMRLQPWQVGEGAEEGMFGGPKYWNPNYNPTDTAGMNKWIKASGRAAPISFEDWDRDGWDRGGRDNYNKWAHDYWNADTAGRNKLFEINGLRRNGYGWGAQEGTLAMGGSRGVPLDWSLYGLDPRRMGGGGGSGYGANFGGMGGVGAGDNSGTGGNHGPNG